MDQVVLINGEMFEDRRFIRTLMYGEGVFETFRFNGDLPSRIKKHYSRLIEGAKLLRIPEITYDDFVYHIRQAVEKLDQKDLYVKVILLSEGNLDYPLLPYRSNIMVVVKPFKPISKEKISITLAPFKVHSSNPLIKVKTTNFAEKVFAKRYAKDKGYDDAVFLNENGEITETTSSNIFWIKGRFMYTPSVDCGLLPGITRETVILEARKQGFNVVEGRFHLDDIKDADLIFVTNALNGIIKVGKFDFVNQEDA